MSITFKNLAHYCNTVVPSISAPVIEEVPVIYRTCSKCNEIKLLSLFYQDNPGKWRKECKTCTILRVKTRKLLNK